MDWKISIDFNPLAEIEAEFSPAAQKQMLAQAAATLAPAMYHHIVEEASSKLHSRRQAYLDALSLAQDEDGTWVIKLDGKAMWIEEGKEAGSMVEDLLGDNPKVSKDGKRYKVIPFKHGPGIGAGHQTPSAHDLTQSLKQEFKRRGIPWGKIEHDAHGQPLQGRIHSFGATFEGPAKTHNGPGQGHGPVGAPRQGPTGIPFLQGVQVYQHKDAKGKMQKSVMTFRIVTEDHEDQGRWMHPGLEGVKLLDEAVGWAQSSWDEVILPQIMGKMNATSKG